MRVMAIDIGDKKIGIALSDALKMTSQGLETYYRKNKKQDFDYLTALMSKHEVSTLVVGLPKNMNGTEGPQAEKAREFAAGINRVSGVEIVFVDERLTTMEAEKMLISGDVSRKKRKNVIDKVAANLILQQYLQRL